MGLFDWVRGVSEGAGGRDQDGDPLYRCVNCGSALERNYKACPDCGSEFVAKTDVADGEDEGES